MNGKKSKVIVYEMELRYSMYNKFTVKRKTKRLKILETL